MIESHKDSSLKDLKKSALAEYFTEEVRRLNQAAIPIETLRFYHQTAFAKKERKSYSPSDSRAGALASVDINKEVTIKALDQAFVV